MKISDAEIFVVGNPPPGHGGRYFIFIKLITDSGISGIGEVYSVPFHPKTVKIMAEDVLARFAIGHDPFKIEALWRRIYSSGYTQRPDVSMMGIASAIEIACWDLIGKECNKPVCELLGGKIHEKLRSYSYIYEEPGDSQDVFHDPDLAAIRAAEYVERGFSAIKIDPVGPYSAFDPRQLSMHNLERSTRYVQRIREAIGDRADILFGTHGQLTPAAAIRLARMMEPYMPLWFEEPTPPDMPEQMARVAGATSIPVATGERLTTKYEFTRVLQTGAASILQMALGRVGGLLEARKIAAIAEPYYAQIAPHLYCGPVEGAANIHFSATLPNFLILESIKQWGGFHAKMLKKPIRWEAGYVMVPSEPGLGIELDEEVLRAHPYEGDLLHLEMHDHPLYG